MIKDLMVMVEVEEVAEAVEKVEAVVLEAAKVPGEAEEIAAGILDMVPADFVFVRIVIQKPDIKPVSLVLK
jgi:hypothetical protein